ncbi:MAG: RNA-binding S4 domain-containing protein [Thiotrichales bacterium]
MTEPNEDRRIRLDKWLWAARFFKTRALATAAIAGGKVQVDAQRVKPSRAVNLGDRVQLRRGFEELTVIVRGLSERRGPASVAQALYEETPESLAARAENAAQRRLQREGMIPSEHRPSGRDRQRIRALSGKH